MRIFVTGVSGFIGSAAGQAVIGIGSLAVLGLAAWSSRRAVGRVGLGAAGKAA